MATLCEACEAVPAEVEDPCDAGRPYRVCPACHSRLIARALRPREWFNLAKTRGWRQYLLHDDFYDEDGTACQPEIAVENPKQHPAPTLDDVRHAPKLLLDYTITRWRLRPDVAVAWQAFDPSIVLQLLERRYATANDVDMQGVLLEVAACALAAHSRQFVAAAWDDFRESRQLGPLARASAACLAFDDGFARVVAALSGMNERTRRDSMHVLSYFHRPEALDWIESNITSPVTENWGRLAAASRFDWERAVAWLAVGRLLSLVALDALAAIVRPQTPLLREYGPQLEHKPDLATFHAVLNEYLNRDPAPRVKMTTRFLVEHSAVLTLP